MIPPPDHFWQCGDCGHNFSSCQSSLLPSLQVKPHCPKCGSVNITGGPIKRGGPDNNEANKRY